MRPIEAGGRETFQNDAMGRQITEQPLLLDYARAKTGIMLHRPMPDELELMNELDWDSYEMVYKGRESALNSPIMIDFGMDFLPQFPTALNSLDHMVIAGDRILDDSAGLANLRHWLFQGGRLWIMLDQTSMETVTALLGNKARCSVVDRVELNDFDLEDVSELQRRSEQRSVESWSSEIPVELLRVFAGTDDVHCRVDGWPVAFWQKVGDGEVLFTTLGARGWIRSGASTTALNSVAYRFFQPLEETSLDSTAISELVNGQIGYRIPSRRLATLILGLNSLLILSFGCWWARCQKLERLAWFVPAMALITTAIFLVVGSRNIGAVPSTVATAQIVRVSDATNESHISALTAVYSQDSGDLELAPSNGVSAVIMKKVKNDDKDRLIVDDNVQGRIVWDDDGRSHWANHYQPSGVVRYIETKQTVSDDVFRVAHGTFDEEGFHGTLAGIDVSECEDALIVVAPGWAAAVSFDSSGAFSVGSGDLLAKGQFIADQLMSDIQRSRQSLLRQLLASTSSTPFGGELSLLVWTPPLEMGVEFDTSFERVGSALMSIPLRIARPPAGTDIQIPAAFIRIESVVGKYGSSTVFNQRTGEWIKVASTKTKTQLRCVVPPALLPLQINQVTVTIKVRAPSRTLSIEGNIDGKATVLVERADPIGLVRFKIDRPEAFELDAAGGFLLLIHVTETELQRQISSGQATGADQFDSTWEIDYVRVDAFGSVR
jgi:hypothetical protein